MSEENIETYNVRIRVMNHQPAVSGYFIEGNDDGLCPKLRPGEVVTLPETHPIFELKKTFEILEFTFDPANRPLRYDDTLSVNMAYMSEADAKAQEERMLGSKERIAKLREARMQAEVEAKAQGTFHEEPQINYSALDLKQGVQAVNADNAAIRGQEPADNETPAVAPPKSNRRKRG